MTEKPHSSIRKFRIGDDLWKRFGDAVDRNDDPEADRSKVMRALVRWYAGDPGAKLPERPEPPITPPPEG